MLLLLSRPVQIQRRDDDLLMLRLLFVVCCVMLAELDAAVRRSETLFVWVGKT